MMAVSAMAAMNTSMLCIAVVVAASMTHTTKAAHITKPNQDASAISGKRREHQGKVRGVCDAHGRTARVDGQQ